MSKRSEFKALDLISAYSDKKKSNFSLEMNLIFPNPIQPRIIGKEEVDDLIDSISRLGLLEPIIVRKEKTKYIIVAGERRFRAVQRLGWSEIPAIVTEASEDVCFEMALAENEKRKNLNPWEVGRAIQYLRKDLKKTAEEVSKLLGYTERYVKQLSSIARLDQKSVMELLITGKPASVKNLEYLLKQKEKRGAGGETISPQSKKPLTYLIQMDLSTLGAKNRDQFMRELKALKKKYGVD